MAYGDAVYLVISGLALDDGNVTGDPNIRGDIVTSTARGSIGTNDLTGRTATRSARGSIRRKTLRGDVEPA